MTVKLIYLTWIAGSSPAMTRKNKVPRDDEKKRIFIREEADEKL